MTDTQKFWPCEHVTKGSFSEWIMAADQVVMRDNWVYCPICEAKRPEEKKKLWHYLKENFPPNGHPGMSDYNWESTAQAAIEEVEKVIDSIKYDGYATHEGLMSTLKQKLRELL